MKERSGADGNGPMKEVHVDKLSAITEEVIGLYETCRMFKTMPLAGGLYEQDGITMDLLYLAGLCRSLGSSGSEKLEGLTE